MSLVMNEYIIKLADNGGVLNHLEKVWSDNYEEPFFFETENKQSEITARDYIEAIMIGFRVAKRGYDKITVSKEPWR